MTTIKRYKYYFLQATEPIIIDAESRIVADSILINFNKETGNLLNVNDLIDLRIESLVIGVSSKKIEDKIYIWVGLNNIKSGWIEMDEYIKIINNNNKKNKY